MRRVPQCALAVVVSLVLCLVVVWGRRDALGQPETTERETGEDVSWEDREALERQRQFEWRLREIQLKAAEAENEAHELDRASKIAEISQHDLATAAYAIAQIRELAAHDEAASILQELLQKAKPASLQRILRIEIAKLHADRDENGEAVGQLRQLIVVE